MLNIFSLISGFFTGSKSKYLLIGIAGLVLLTGFFYIKSIRLENSILESNFKNAQIEIQYSKDQLQLLQDSNRQINEDLKKVQIAYGKSLAEWDTVYDKENVDRETVYLENPECKEICSVAYHDNIITNDAFEMLKSYSQKRETK